jgi:FkbM family methyltransferase
MSVFSSIINRKFYGKKSFQWLFEKMYFMSLYGMNIGGASDFHFSGESSVTDYLENLFPGLKSPLIIDVGANNGSYARMLAEALLAKGMQPKLYLFEPNRDLAGQIFKNTAGLEAQVFSMALSSAPGFLTLHVAASHTLSSLQNNSGLYEGMQYRKTVPVEVDTLDNFINQHEIPFVHFLKIDVEGHELEVMRGTANALFQNKIGLIQFEFSRGQMIARNYLHDFFELLKDHYTIHRMLKDGISGPLTWHPRWEVFQTTNFLAIPRKKVLNGN